MPNDKLKLKKDKAKALSKLYIQSGLNQAEVARQKGVTRQAIQQQVNNPLVQETLAELLKTEFNPSFIIKKFKQGLNAQKVISAFVIVKSNDPTVKNKRADARSTDFIEVPDMDCQHKWFKTLLEAQEYLKNNGGQSVGVQVFVGSEVVSKIKELEHDQIRSNHR